MTSCLIVIPARLSATRLPGKPLADIAGEPMIVHVWRRAVEADCGPVVVATDAELPAASGYGALLADLGFRPVEEIQPARHRLSLPLNGVGEDDVLAGVAKQTRQRIRRAEEAGVLVRRFDARSAADPGAGFVAGPAAELSDALRTFHGLVRATGERRGFRLGPVEPNPC